jgi:hypothetical protein
MGGNRGGNLADNKRDMRTDTGNKLSCGKSQILKIENVRTSSPNLFDCNIHQLSVATVTLLSRPGFLKGGAIDDHVFSLPSCRHHPGGIEVAVTEAGLLECVPLRLIRLRRSLRHHSVMMCQKAWIIGIEKEAGRSAGNRRWQSCLGWLCLISRCDALA